MPSHTLQLIPYDPTWAAKFDAEAARIREALGETALAIEHVGSTAVPGLLAKPVVDIAVAVESIARAEASVLPLTALGYQHRGMHGGDPRRRYFVRDVGGRRAFQLHLYILPALGWDETLRFRDLLRAQPESAAAYEREKRRVAEAVDWDKAAYSEAKSPFIEAVLRGDLPED